MKKIIFGLLTLLLLTGCDVEYNLNISDKVVFTEETNFLGSKSNVEFTDRVNTTFNWPYPAVNDIPMNIEEPVENPDENYYKYSKIDENDRYGIKFSYTYLTSVMHKARFWHYCYTYYDFLRANNMTTLSTSTKFLCFEDEPTLNKVDVKITTVLKADVHNADEFIVNDNDVTYIWHINKTNAGNKPIYFRFFNDKYYKDELQPDIPLPGEEKDSNLVVIIIFVIALGGLVIYYIFIRKNKSKNDI